MTRAASAEVKMEPRTDSMSSKVWIEAQEGVKVRALEAYTSTVSLHERPLPPNDFYDLLEKTSVRFLKSPSTIERELDVECQAWDALSDEALEIFERTLG